MDEQIKCKKHKNLRDYGCCSCDMYLKELSILYKTEIVLLYEIKGVNGVPHFFCCGCKKKLLQQKNGTRIL